MIVWIISWKKTVLSLLISLEMELLIPESLFEKLYKILDAFRNRSNVCSILDSYIGIIKI